MAWRIVHSAPYTQPGGCSYFGTIGNYQPGKVTMLSLEVEATTARNDPATKHYTFAGSRPSSGLHEA